MAIPLSRIVKKFLHKYHINDLHWCGCAPCVCHGSAEIRILSNLLAPWNSSDAENQVCVIPKAWDLGFTGHPHKDLFCWALAGTPRMGPFRASRLGGYFRGKDYMTNANKLTAPQWWEHTVRSWGDRTAHYWCFGTAHGSKHVPHSPLIPGRSFGLPVHLCNSIYYLKNKSIDLM